MKYLAEIYREILKEYLTTMGSALKDYFKMTPEQHKMDLPFSYAFMISDFIEYYNSEHDTEIDVPNDDFDYVEDIYESNKEMFNAFADYLYERVRNHDMPIMDAEYPTWTFYDKPTFIKNQWLIHGTDDAAGIASEGFTHGIMDIQQLGLTTAWKQSAKSYGGYNFAYTPSDFDRYGMDGSSPKYGSEFVIFQASGVRVWHYGDEEYQTIFWGEDAKNIIPVTEGEEKAWAVRSVKSWDSLYEADDPEDIIYWVEQNWAQYRSHLVKGA